MCGWVHNIPQLACQVSSYFPSLVTFQMMKCVNILESNINSRRPEQHSLVSSGAICCVANESFRAKAAPYRLNASAAWASYIGKTKRAVCNYNVNILSLAEEGMFEINHRDLSHATVYSRQRNALVIVNSVDWCYQRELMSSSVNVSPCERITEDMKAEIRLMPTRKKQIDEVKVASSQNTQTKQVHFTKCYFSKEDQPFCPLSVLQLW